MNRRSFVGLAAGALLPGCAALDLQGETSPRTESSTQHRTQPPTETATRTRTVESSAPPTTDVTSLALETSSENVRPASRESPARVRLGLTNAAESPVTLGVGPTPPLTSYRGERADGEGAAVLYPVDWSEYVGVSDANGDDEMDVTDYLGGCWRAVDRLEPDALLHRLVLEAGESVTGEYEFLSVGKDCPTDGVYEFSQRVEQLSSGKTVEVRYSVTVPVQ